MSFCSIIKPGVSSEQNYRVLETSITSTRIGEGVVACMCFSDLIERIEIERRLLHANSFLQNIIHSSVDGIVALDMKGNVLIFNEGAERILGYRADEVVGHPEPPIERRAASDRQAATAPQRREAAFLTLK